MKYIATRKTFTRINETSGTLQNTSKISDVEVSNEAVENTGIILAPQDKFSFSDATLYVRCVGGGGAEIRVVPFMLDFGISQGGTSTATDTDAEVDDKIKLHIIELVCSVDGVRGYHDFRSRISGARMFIEIHLELDGNSTLYETHAIADKAEEKIMTAYPQALKVMMV